MIATQGLVACVVVALIIAVRIAIRHTFKRTAIDLIIEAFESWAKFWVHFVKALRAAQTRFRESREELREERA